jgi:hypothetical protein
MARPKRENGETVTYVQIHRSVANELSKYCRENGLVQVHSVTQAIKQYLKEKNV